MIIAIDPDMKKPGVCVLNDDGTIVDLFSLSFYELIELIGLNKSFEFVIEDVNQVKTIYAANRRDNKSVGLQIAQNVGMVKAAGTIICDLITDITGKPPKLAPVGLGKQVKRNATLFKQITGWKGRTNEDMRDAYAVAIWYHSKKRTGHTS